MGCTLIIKYESHRGPTIGVCFTIGTTALQAAYQIEGSPLSYQWPAQVSEPKRICIFRVAMFFGLLECRFRKTLGNTHGLRPNHRANF